MGSSRDRQPGEEEHESEVISLRDATLNKVDDIANHLITSISESLVEIKEATESEDSLHDADDLTVFESFTSQVVRFSCLLKHVPLFTLSSLCSEGKTTPFEYMNDCLEVCLRVFKFHEEKFSSLTSQFYLSGTILMQASTFIMTGQVIWKLSQLTALQAPPDDQIQSLKIMTKKLLDFCEAGASDLEGSIFKVKLPLMARCICSEVLISLYPLYSGECNNLVEANMMELFSRTLSRGYIEQAFEIIYNIVYLVVFEVPHRSNVSISDEAAFTFTTYIHKLLSALTLDTLGLDIRNLKYASNLVALSGVTTESNPSIWAIYAKGKKVILPENLIVIDVLDDTWHSIMSKYIESRISLYVEDVQQLVGANPEATTQHLEGSLGSITELILKSTQKVLFLCNSLVHGSLSTAHTAKSTAYRIFG